MNFLQAERRNHIAVKRLYQHNVIVLNGLSVIDKSDVMSLVPNLNFNETVFDLGKPAGPLGRYSMLYP